MPPECLQSAGLLGVGADRGVSTIVYCVRRARRGTRGPPSAQNGTASAVATVMGAELPALLAREFGTASAFLVKDPRMCRFVPFWLRILQAERDRAVGILVFRNPADVASSLAERDGLLPQFSLLMWLRHMLDAERSTRRSLGRSSSIAISSERLAARGQPDWCEHRGRWSCPPEVAAEAVEQFLRPDLCHHAAGQAAIGVGQPLADWLTRTYDALGSLASGGTARRAEAFHALDDVRAQFEAASSLFGRADEERRQALLTGFKRLTPERVDLRAHASALECRPGAIPQSRQRRRSPDSGSARAW